MNPEPVNAYEEKEQLLRKSYPPIRARFRSHCSFLLDLAVDSDSSTIATSEGPPARVTPDAPDPDGRRV